MTLQQLNSAEPEEANAPLLRCCGSKAWATALIAKRPFHDREQLLTAAEFVWWALTPGDWLEAFSAHPRIGAYKSGDVKISPWSSAEQSGFDSAKGEIVDRIAQGNEDYQRRFGWIFLVNATGKSALQILQALESRLKNESADELPIAAGEQARITRLRLNKLLNE